MKEQIEITKEAIKHFENLYSEEIEAICSYEYFIYISLKNQLAIMEHLSKEITITHILGKNEMLCKK